MGFWKSANRAETIRYTAPDGEDWIDMRAELSKGEVNKLIVASPKGAEDTAGSLSFIEKFATIAIVDWSNTDEKGKSVPFTLDAYYGLGVEAAQWLDKTLSEHLQKTMGAEVEELEGKPTT